MQSLTIIGVIHLLLSTVGRPVLGNPLQQPANLWAELDPREGFNSPIDQPILAEGGGGIDDPPGGYPGGPGGLGLEYGQCYTLSHEDYGGLGLLPNGIYKFKSGNTNRQIRVCHSPDNCKKWGPDQTVSRGQQFYLYDRQGAASPLGSGWVSAHGYRWLGVLNPANKRELYAKFRGKPNCAGDDTKCPVCVGLKENYGGFIGLKEWAGQLLTTQNSNECITLKFKPVSCHDKDDDWSQGKDDL